MAENTKNVELSSMEKLISLCKRRGFIFPSGEMYGGLQGFWDFGPLGVELKNNIKNSWWKRFVQERGDVVGLDSAIITNPKVWEKSGHAEKFADFIVECKECNRRFKAEDILPQDIQATIIRKSKELDKKLSNSQDTADTSKEKMRDFLVSLVPEINKNTKCPNCSKYNWTPPDQFYLMLQTFIGPSLNTASRAYLRPETAQNIFINFELVRQSMRLKVPFGIAQIGKAFRNEITPGNYFFRSREFEQMEIEFFINPKEDSRWFNEWLDAQIQWYQDLGMKKEYLHQYEQKKEELAHYAKKAVDIEYDFPFGQKELQGIHNRGDYDLKAHGLDYRDEESNTKFIPYVIETSAGVDRAALAFLLDAYEEVEGGRTTTTESSKEKEVVLRLHKDLAPVKVAILPLSKKEKLSGLAKKIADSLRKEFVTQYDEVSSIGRRYRRQDEIGTPYCVTVDFDSLEDKKVTVRDRDTMKQDRIAIGELTTYLKEKLFS